MGFFRRFRDATVCVALLALPFFFLKANLKDPSKTNAIDRVVLQASAPFQYMATQLALAVSSVWEDYLYLVDVKRDNDRLRAENTRLREAARALANQATENRQLRKLLSLRDQIHGELLSAQVIGKEVSPFFRVMRIRLDRGERDRVRPGMPVLSTEGLVGQVRRSFGRYSDVLLTADKTSAIDVVIQRTGARGMLKGTGGNQGYRCRIQDMLRDQDVVEGDLVVTSGLGQRFPAAIVVGRVSKVVRRAAGMYQEVEVAPAVRFSHLESVMVLTEGSREQGLVGSAPHVSARR